MKKWLLCLLFSLVIMPVSARSLNVEGKSVKIGDHLSAIWDRWGSEQYRILSDKTCHPKNPRICSYSRLVWKRGDTFVMVQEVRAKIINIKTTKNDKALRASF